MMSLFVSKLRVYYLFRNNPKILLLIVFKDIFRFIPVLNLYFGRKFKNEILRLKKLSLFGSTFFFNEKSFPAILEMYAKRERFKFKEFIPKKGDVVIDIGATLGDHTIIYSKLVGDNGIVIAIEPNKDSFSLLKKNIEFNKANNVICINAAAWNKKGLLKVSKKDFYTLDSVCISCKDNNYYMVKSIKIDDIVNRFGIKEVDLIKIDVEGAEYKVLRGGIKTIREFHPKIIVEVHEYYGIKENDILNLLKRFRYKVVRKYNLGKGVYELFLK